LNLLFLKSKLRANLSEAEAKKPMAALPWEIPSLLAHKSIANHLKNSYSFGFVKEKMRTNELKMVYAQIDYQV